MCVCVEDSSDHFKIDANSGEIRTTRALSHDYGPSYRVTVIASDQGVPPLQGQAVINIQVIAHITQMGENALKVFFNFVYKCIEWRYFKNVNTPFKEHCRCMCTLY